MKRRGRKAVALLAVALVAGSVTVAGYAWWSSTGSGSGTATTGTDTAWQVTAAAATGLPLAPDGPVQTVEYTVTNNGSGSQYLTSVTVSVANPDGSPWSVGSCNADDFRLVGAAAGASLVHTALQQTFGPGGSDSAAVEVQMVDTGDNQNDCKNVTVPLHFAAA
jgi:hypothetical protein